MGIYDEARRLNEQENFRMRSRVSVSIYPFKRETDVIIDVPDTEVPWDADPDYRSWGIRGIDVFLRDKIVISYSETRYLDDDRDEVTEKEIEVDLSEITYENTNWYPGKAVKPTMLNVYLKEDGTVDYAKTSIDFEYWEP